MRRIYQYIIDQMKEDENFNLTIPEILDRRCPFIFMDTDCECPCVSPSDNDCLECWIKEV